MDKTMNTNTNDINTNIDTISPATISRGKNIGLWVVQILLALFFLMIGGTKLTSTPQMMVQQGMEWAATVPPGLIKFIGVMEVLGAIGLVAPMAFKVKPRLTAWAGLGLATIVILGAGLHASRSEWMPIPFNLLFAALGIFVFKGRKNS